VLQGFGADRDFQRASRMLATLTLVNLPGRLKADFPSVRATGLLLNNPGV
jgi:hypothetical protein